MAFGTPITGQATTYNLPNFTGELFRITPSDTPFLSAIGGLGNGKSVDSVFWQWQLSDLRAGEANRQKLEGQNAPTAEARERTTEFNVVEIHHEAVEMSYTRQAAFRQYATNVPSYGAGSQYTSGSGIDNELAFQVDNTLKSLALDIEKTFLASTGFNNPTTNASARRTRGLGEAITTNVITVDSDNVTAGAQAGPLTAALVLDAMQKAWENGGLQVDETRTVITNATQKRNLTKLFITDKGYEEKTRNVGGVSVTTIETDFGSLNIMLNRHMDNDKLFFVSLEECSPVFLNVPGKGHLFLEPIAKTGAFDKFQIYGEVGLEYGNQRKHAKITNLTTTVQ